MTSKELAALIGEADEKYILEAIPRKRVPAWKVVLPMAAAAVLMIAAGSFWAMNSTKGAKSADAMNGAELLFGLGKKTADEECMELDMVMETMAGEDAVQETGAASNYMADNAGYSGETTSCAYYEEPEGKSAENPDEVAEELNTAQDDGLTSSPALIPASENVYYSAETAENGCVDLYLTLNAFTEGQVLTLTLEQADLLTLTFNGMEILDQTEEKITFRSIWNGDPALNAPELWMQAASEEVVVISGIFGEEELTASEDFRICVEK